MLKPSCVRKQRVWKLPTFLLYRFVVTAAYLISFLPLFLSTWCINTDRTCLLWLRSYVYISILFFWVQNFYALFILIWDPFFHLFVFVFILDKHPWHAIDVFVRLPECCFNSAIILQPKKLFYFTLVYLVFQFFCVILGMPLMCLWDCLSVVSKIEGAVLSILLWLRM